MRGQPRIQYERTYVLLPPSAGVAWVEAVICATWDEKRYTIGGSADDAGIGDFDVRRVIAVNPGGWPGDLRAFFEEHYPGVQYAPIEATTPEELRQKLASGESSPWQQYLLWQCDPRWEGERFGATSCASTICQDGCYITNLAMTQRIYGIKADASPVTVDEALGPGGYSSCRALWSAVEAQCSIKIQSSGNLDDHLAAGGVAMIEVLPTSLEHFVLAVEKQGDDYLVLDSWRNEVALLSKRYSGIESFRLLSKVETSPPPLPTGRELVSVHIQGNSSAAADYIQRVQPAVVKLVMGMERAQWVKSVSPDTLVVYRQWVRNQGEFWEDPDPHRGARRYLETFLDSLHRNAQWIDYVETVNETIATGDTAGIQRTAAFDAAFCEALQEEGLPARPVILTAGVGNPQHGDEVRLMLPAVRACVATGGAVGYHSYWGARVDGYCSMSDAWEHFGGRALESWDPVFRSAGLYPHYLFGEGGAVYISGGHMPSSEAGWGYKETLNGDAQKYVAQILEFRRRLMEWNQHHGNRALGATLFTAGGGQDWRHFELTANVLGPLADAVT